MFHGRNLKTESFTILAQCSLSAPSENGRKPGGIEMLQWVKMG